MSIWISHLLLGLSLAAPIGPINAAQMDRGIKGGFLHAWLVGLGAMVADGIFMLLVYFGVIHFLNIPFMKTFLLLFGFFILTYIGVESLLTVGKTGMETRGGNESHVKSFSAGFIMSISNPLSILFWMGIYGSVLADMIAKYDAKRVLLYSCAIMAGIMLWDVAMALVASMFRRILTGRLIGAVSVISGLSLIGFGLYFGYEAYRILFGN
ncbi:LysE family translocator [Paenibacillus motobuensis]|uniref:Amino acid transporter n=1 Tax=Paenibacillus lutimineralis TaxID=2707005 RepID=A0A3S9UY05_9BACL|nr:MULTISPECIES: LysE family transporter [Paenibacillus]AZS15188.1 amino acid transporter [Paenibacillus lutimineralis]MCM3039431.1 LysE family translocator [Paenibacillus lutimineralis]MCM3646535.1 LysE family translocator [Paenibacillus motobuensis]